MEFYSQYGQDKYLYENFFKNIKGVFVDIGADDGILLSNTYFFEKTLGWTGLCVEPREERFKLLQQNRKCFCENCAILNREGKFEFLEIIGEGGDLSGLVAEYTKKHLKNVKRYTLKKTGKKKNKRKILSPTKKKMIKCCSLSTLFNKYQLNKIEYLSVDVEGAEVSVLSSLDFDKFDVSVISVENHFTKPSIRKFLKSKGYVLFDRVYIDDIFIKRDCGL